MATTTRATKTAIFCGLLTLACAAQACSGDGGSGDDGDNETHTGSATDSGIASGEASTGADAGSGSIAENDDASADGGPATCNGYEPCGINAVAAPTGYTLSMSGVTTDDLSMQGSCTDLADCHMWNTHYTSNWNGPDGTPVNPYWNRMGSPFWWPESRYIVDVPAKTITTAKLHVMMPGEMYKYADGTVEMKIDRTSGAKTCYARTAATLEYGQIYSMGGTGNLGVVKFNIGILPGDMGNTGNASSCNGSGNKDVAITEDEAKAAGSFMASNGKYGFCLLRPGHDYWVSFQSSGKTPTTDCATATCSMGGFAFGSGFTMSDGGAFSEEVPCPP